MLPLGCAPATADRLGRLVGMPSTRPAGSHCGTYDFVNRDNDPVDDEGNGTHVAGIVAADEALRGVSPEASLLACKVLDASGSGSTSNIIAGIERAANPDQDATTVDRAPFFLCKSNGGPG